MRREYLRQREMDVQQRSILQEHLANSQFAQKLLGIPMFKAAVDTAGDAYVKVKDSNALVGKSIELALNFSSAVVDKLAPIAEKVAAPITTKVDAIAAASLDGLIARVPVINEEPKEIVQNTRSAIEKRVTVINGYTEAALKTWPVQSALDIYESILSTAYNTLDNVLPPSKEESCEQNGLASTKESVPEEDKHKRGMILAQRTCLMLSTAFKRVFGICQEQAKTVGDATGVVINQVKSVVSDHTTPTAPSTDQTNGTNNGDSNNKQGKKKNKKNNQNQD